MFIKMYGLGRQAYLNSSFNCFDCIVSPAWRQTPPHTYTFGGKDSVHTGQNLAHKHKIQQYFAELCAVFAHTDDMNTRLPVLGDLWQYLRSDVVQHPAWHIVRHQCFASSQVIEDLQSHQVSLLYCILYYFYAPTLVHQIEHFPLIYLTQLCVQEPIESVNKTREVSLLTFKFGSCSLNHVAGARAFLLEQGVTLAAPW